MLCGLICVMVTELWINRIWETWQSVALRNYDIHQCQERIIMKNFSQYSRVST